jgi:phenylacetate-CoA ligase
VRHAAASSPYYRERLAPWAGTLGTGVGANADVPITELPILTRATLMTEFDRIVCDPRLRLADLERHAAGPDADALYLRGYRVFVDGCRAGDSVTGIGAGAHARALFLYSRAEWTLVPANMLRWMAASGATGLGLRLATIGASSPQHLVTRAFADLGSPVPGAHGGLGMDDGEMETGVWTMGTVDGASLFDAYVMTEAGLIGTECQHRAGVHVSEDLVLVETVDEANQPVPPGVPAAKVLVTNLANYAQPLIRYEVTDRVTLSSEPCPCGRPFARIARVDRNPSRYVFTS